MVSIAFACSRGILFLQQARGPGLDEDDVDRVTGRVVEVTSDSATFLGGRKPALALGFALRTVRALLELSHLLAPQPRAVAGDPHRGPEHDAEQDLAAGKRVFAEAEEREVEGEQAGHEAERERGSKPSLGSREGDEVEGDRSVPTGGPSGYPSRKSTELATAVAMKTRSGARRHATSGKEASAASRNASASGSSPP